MVVAKDQVMLAHCEGIVMAKLESPLGVENGVVEPSLQAYPPEGIYIARTLVRDRRRVPLRVMNAIRRDQKLMKGSPLAHCETVTLVPPYDLEQPYARASSSKLQDVITVARPHFSNGEFQELEGLLTEYEDIFTVDSQDHRRINKVYHCIVRETPGRFVNPRGGCL
jgi:hypothetical protein